MDILLLLQTSCDGHRFRTKTTGHTIFSSNLDSSKPGRLILYKYWLGNSAKSGFSSLTSAESKANTVCNSPGRDCNTLPLNSATVSLRKAKIQWFANRE